MADLQLILAKPNDAQLIHTMKYDAFLPLYQRYRDEETNPVKEPIQKVIDQLKSNVTDYYIITLDSTPIGAVRVVNDGMDHGEQSYRISPLFILPEHQNQGFGYRALQLLFSKYPNADQWRLSTIKQEAGNCHLYEKCGFCPVGDEVVINHKMTIVYYEKSCLQERL